MEHLDDIDMEILTHLVEDARRPFSEIGESVGLSGPAVSDRVTRLEEAGVIKRFTVDVDRSQLRAGVQVFVRVSVPAGAVESLREEVAEHEAVEHVLVTADGDLLFLARVQARNVRRWLDGLLGDIDGVDYQVSLIDDAEWRPSLADAAFAIACAECGNTVDAEGESTRIDGDLYHFCCPSCRVRFEDRYDRIEEGA